jgi:hypothetical protein
MAVLDGQIPCYFNVLFQTQYLVYNFGERLYLQNHCLILASLLVIRIAIIWGSRGQ